ncbi:Nuclear transport factor 2 [Blastocladiella emersonii ATCC 22665]|nr:Nuclear transport factor 2 [Blastocladiella emersonii ATCC 22665]
MAADPKAVAKQFVDYYYQIFDTNRAGLRQLYREHSMMSFEGTDLQGVNAIMNKLENLPFSQIQHRVLSVDAQPSNPTAGSLLIIVTGQLLTNGESQPLFYCQTFQLIPENNSFWIYNDVFRLNYG